VLTLVSQGLTYKEVGAKLFLAEPTIKYHMGEIIERLHVKNRREAIEYARRMKLERK
jgi:two-component system NarL family response regulator